MGREGGGVGGMLGRVWGRSRWVGKGRRRGGEGLYIVSWDGGGGMFIWVFAGVFGTLRVDVRTAVS